MRMYASMAWLAARVSLQLVCVPHPRRGARVACVPRSRLHQSFTRTLLFDAHMERSYGIGGSPLARRYCFAVLTKLKRKCSHLIRHEASANLESAKCASARIRKRTTSGLSSLILLNGSTADTVCFLHMARTQSVREKDWRSHTHGTQAT